MKHYILQNLIALDQLVNTLLGGWADETLSSRAYRAELNGTRFGRIMRPLIDAIFFWDEDHCAMSYRSELLRKQLNLEVRGPVLIPRD